MSETISAAPLWLFGSIVHDWIVGTTAIGIGAVALLAACFNWDFFFHFPKLRIVDERWGRTQARAFCALFGLMVLALGISVVAGFRLRLFE